MPTTCIGYWGVGCREFGMKLAEGGIVVLRGGVGEAGRLESSSCNIGDACSILSQMYGSWYFPRFLFRVRSLIHMNIFDGPGMTMYFLVYNVEVVWVQWMTCGWAVVKDWGRGLEIFFNPFPQCPAWFPYISLRAIDVWTFVMVDDATFVCFWIFVLGVD